MALNSTLHLSDSKSKDKQIARVRFPGKDLTAVHLLANYLEALLEAGVEPLSIPLHSEQLPLDSTQESIYTVTGYVKRTR